MNSLAALSDFQKTLKQNRRQLNCWRSL